MSSSHCILILIYTLYDPIVRYRSGLRTHHLVTKGDSRAKYNIINGGGRHIPEIPERVAKPAHYTHSI